MKTRLSLLTRPSPSQLYHFQPTLSIPLPHEVPLKSTWGTFWRAVWWLEGNLTVGVEKGNFGGDIEFWWLFWLQKRYNWDVIRNREQYSFINKAELLL